MTKAVYLFSPMRSYYYSVVSWNYWLIALLSILLAYLYPRRNEGSVCDYMEQRKRESDNRPYREHLVRSITDSIGCDYVFTVEFAGGKFQSCKCMAGVYSDGVYIAEYILDNIGKRN